MSASLKRVCVFAGSSPGARPEYAAGARRLGAALAERGIELVYGGGSVGLMAAVADAVLERGGRVIGVIPEGLVRREVAHGGLTELRIVASMHERKALMSELSDAFVTLPGGLGTLEELFEVLTWAQLGIHAKPCGLLDVGGYYQGLVAFLEHAVEHRFVRAEHRAALLVEHEPEGLLERFSGYRPPRVEKWLHRDEV